MGIVVGVVHPTAAADIIIITPILHLTFSDNLLLCTSVQPPTPRLCLQKTAFAELLAEFTFSARVMPVFLPSASQFDHSFGLPQHHTE